MWEREGTSVDCAENLPSTRRQLMTSTQPNIREPRFVGQSSGVHVSLRQYELAAVNSSFILHGIASESPLQFVGNSKVSNVDGQEDFEIKAVTAPSREKQMTTPKNWVFICGRLTTRKELQIGKENRVVCGLTRIFAKNPQM